MFYINLLYTCQQDFMHRVTESKLDRYTSCLVRIYTAACTCEEAVKIARDIKEVLPNAKVIGSSCSGVILNGIQHDEDTLVVVDVFDEARLEVNTYCFYEKEADALAQEVLCDLERRTPALTHVLCGDHYPDVYNFLEEINSRVPGLRLAGGIAGDVLPRNLSGYVFTEEGVVKNGLVVATIESPTLTVFQAVNISHTPISPIYTLTKCDGPLLLEIEDKPAVEWCREQFGMENLQEYTDWQLIAENDGLIRFPLILDSHSGASRFVKFSRDDQQMSLYFSHLKEQTRFRIGYTSPIACVQHCFEICNSLMNAPIESLFCYTCLFRKLYLGNCAEWELRPFHKANVCGAFMMGEIAYINDRNELLNGSCSFVGLADQDAYIQPDFSVFDDLYKIKDDNEKLVNYVLQKQNSAMSRENEDLLQKLMKQQQKEKELLYVDSNTGIANSLKYTNDQLIMQFDKMCMVQVENFELLTARLGQEGYYQLVRAVASEIREYTKNGLYDGRVFYYILNSSILFMAANSTISDALFMQIADEYYNRYRVVKFPDSDDMLVNRFVIILHQSDLITSGLSTLQRSKHLQSRFLISDDSTMDTPELNLEMQMINVLNYAIDNKKIIPYFQGIYDNQTGKIDKYEALMRIEDQTGTICLPSAFIQIAKKYHMYGALSRLMIGQVLTLFADTNVGVGINLSASDINSSETQEFIFSQLEKMRDASNVVFEILEDENLGNMEKLKPFIDRLRSHGAKVAIDDFGSGYSNFIEILMIEPEYIKIDMSIVKHINSSSINQKVMQNISFLGKQLNAMLVAEGVETSDIQAMIEHMDVHYSQGFLFSRPAPFETLQFTDESQNTAAAVAT